MATIPHLVMDDFLPQALHLALLSHALQVDDFAPGRVLSKGESTYLPESRKGHLSNDRLGSNLPPFRAALRQAFPGICAALNITPFELAALELRLAAHTDGDYFKPHRDTLTGAERDLVPHDRIVTAVYYLHRQPRAFQGGELKLHPFGPGETIQIEPRSNRLAVFPAFLMHEVLPVRVPSGDFADSRFSVSCWFDRARQDTPERG